MRLDAHNSRHTLEQTISNIEKDASIPEKNKTAIIDFHKYGLAEGLSIGRVLRYLFDLKVLSRFLGKYFESATKQDIENVLVLIGKSSYAEYTKHGFRITIRKFYKWLRKSEELPPEVKWFKIKEPRDRIKLPEDMLSEEDIARLINAAESFRDKAFVSILYESGCRIGEMLSIQLKHITFDDYGAQVLVEGKTGFRRVRIISSVPYLTDWLNTHPQKDDHNAPLWLSVHKKILVNYDCYRRMLERIKKRAGIKKSVNPHNFRHSRATYLANHLTEAQMKEIFGWTKDSDMAAVYVHLSGRDVDKALLKTHGIIMEEAQHSKSVLEPKQCKRCNDSNPATNKFCRSCGLPLDEKSATDILTNEIKRRHADDVLDKLMKDEEFKEILVKKLIRFH